MGKRKPVSLLNRERAQRHEQQRPSKKQKKAAPQNGNAQAHQQQGNRAGGSSGGQQERGPRKQQQQLQGLRPTSAVHSQAAFAVRRLLEADASKRGGATLKSLTLAPHITAKKVRP